jgi:hypothetical protein
MEELLLQQVVLQIAIVAADRNAIHQVEIASIVWQIVIVLQDNFVILKVILALLVMKIVNVRDLLLTAMSILTNV